MVSQVNVKPQTTLKRFLRDQIDMITFKYCCTHTVEQAHQIPLLLLHGYTLEMLPHHIAAP